MESKPPMLCIHGFTGSWRNWTPVFDALDATYAVSAARLLGHRDGEPLPKGGTSSALGLLVDGLEREMDTAGIDTAHLVGNSLGGWLALELASRGRARSVVALSPGFGWLQTVVLPQFSRTSSERTSSTRHFLRSRI
ncbi:alpha/beta fold hydrolase [Rhodococcus fascians]|nr:alpha/beta fold hydrolase [Rhodococcus fascians]MBY4114594.1 alpha/beta fold hydrolase [Rhodococcus fascians]